MSRITQIVASLLALSGLVAAPAHAIQVYGLDASGNIASGPLSTSWSVYSGSPAGSVNVADVSGGAGTDWGVSLGVNDFGDPETGDGQTQAIFGASTQVSGYYGYVVDFSFDGFTWDSYNQTQPVNEGASDGYWDLFGLNINSDDQYYWDMVSGGSGSANDPLFSTDPAGSAVVETGGALSGTTWGWGGLDYAAGFFEELHGDFSISMTGDVSEVFSISAFLDTATPEDSDEAYPSWGCFNLPSSDCPEPTGGDPQDVAEPSALAVLALSLIGMGLVSRRRG